MPGDLAAAVRVSGDRDLGDAEQLDPIRSRPDVSFGFQRCNRIHQRIALCYPRFSRGSRFSPQRPITCTSDLPETGRRQRAHLDQILEADGRAGNGLSASIIVFCPRAVARTVAVWRDVQG